MRKIKHIVRMHLYPNYKMRYLIYKYINLDEKNFFDKLRLILIRRKLILDCNIVIGKSTKLEENVYFPHCQNIVIGEGVKIGRGTTIYQDVTIGQNKGKYPSIGDDVTIYTGSKIIGGVTIGNRAIIGANSVVTKDIPENTIYAGNPAKFIKLRDEEDVYY